MNRTKNRKINAARTALAAVAALGLLTAFMGQGFADPANNGAASAFGLEATGLLPIARTPEVSVTGEGRQEQGGALREREPLLNLPVSTLAISATLNTVAEVRLAGGINPAITEGGNTREQETITERDVNARGYAAVENLLVVVGGNVTVNPLEEPEFVEDALVDLQTIEAEAVAKCVNNRPVFDTGFNVVGDQPDDILNLSADPLGDLVATLADLLSAVPNVLAIELGVRENIPNGVRITALRIRLLDRTQVINVAQAEARMTEPCGVAAPPPPSPAARLAVTGGGGVSAILGGSLLAGAVLMMVFVRKYRFSE